MGRMCGHNCRIFPNETIEQALVRHEHYLALRMGIQEDQKVLDVGCGIGHPARSIARLTGANITGINISDLQLRQARQLTQDAGLGYQINYVNENFMEMSFADETFDAAYAIEATCYAPSLKDVYSEVYRVLKPGATFGCFEVVMTDRYDDNDPVHRDIRHKVERGGGISHIVTASEAIAAMKAAGFELLTVDDLAERPDQIPWQTQFVQLPPETRGIFPSLLMYLITIARCSKIGSHMLQTVYGKLEGMGVIPPGSQKMMDLVVTILDGEYQGAELKIFSSMFLMLARKPVN